MEKKVKIEIFNKKFSYTTNSGDISIFEKTQKQINIYIEHFQEIYPNYNREEILSIICIEAILALEGIELGGSHDEMKRKLEKMNEIVKKTIS